MFPCADGQIVLAVGNDGQFAKLCEVIGRPDLARDERFAKNASRVRNNAALSPLLAERFRDFGTGELTAALDAAGVPCGPINTVPQVFEDPQVVHRRMLRHLPHPVAGTVPQVVSPMNFAEAPLAFDRGAAAARPAHGRRCWAKSACGEVEIASLTGAR